MRETYGADIALDGMNRTREISTKVSFELYRARNLTVQGIWILVGDHQEPASKKTLLYLVGQLEGSHSTHS